MKSVLKTSIQLDDAGLISIPVSVCKATSKEADISFKMGDPQGGPVVQQYVDANGAVVAKDDMTRTYNGTIIDQDAIDSIKDATKKRTLKVEEFVSAKDFTTKYAERIEGRYFLQPDTKNPTAASALALFVEAMKSEKVVAISEICLRDRQSLVAFYPGSDDAVIMVTMAYADEVRAADEAALAHTKIKVNKDEVALARQLIQTKKSDGAFCESAFDDAIPEKRKLVDAALAGQTPVAPAAKPAATTTPSLAEALKASLEAQGVSA